MTINIGSKVHWTHTSQGKRTVSMRRREGIVTEIAGDMANVKHGQKTSWVELSRLRTDEQPSQITELVELMFRQ